MTSPIAPVAYRQSQGGAESQSGGLIIHRGPLTAALVRAIGSPAQNTAVFPRDGEGSVSSMELGHYPKSSSFIQSYDRDKSQWLPLYLNASVLGLNTQTGQPVTMPPGSAQALLGNWGSPSAYALPQSGVWTETDVRVNVTLSGQLIRVEYSACVLGPAATNVYLGIGFDTTLAWPSLACMTFPQTNYAFQMAGVVYHPSPPAGAHRMSIWLYGTAGAGFYNGAITMLCVTEQRA